jgi:cysteine desulfurase family protein (TIGR01976 family)
VCFDGPAGTQVPRRVIDAIVGYLTKSNANHGGAFATSIESDSMVASALQAVADLLNAASPDEVIFGPNMTTLTFHFTRAVARTLRAGDEVMVTRMDHDANVTPWVIAARESGAIIRHVDIHPDDCTLDEDDFRKQLNPRTRWVALTCASNAAGTINDVAKLTGWARDAGARVFLDAVHFAPHGLIDVQAWNADALACSAYKFFGPHVGILWAKRELLDALPVDKVRPATNDLPGRWMTGTPNFEGIAGVAACIDYLAAISGQTTGDRRACLAASLDAVRKYEMELARRLLDGLRDRPRARVWGISTSDRLHARVPTVALTIRDRHSAEVAAHLGRQSIYAWSGNMYALALTERLGLETSGGVVRLGLVHYNTVEEIDRCLAALDTLV